MFISAKNTVIYLPSNQKITNSMNEKTLLYEMFEPFFESVMNIHVDIYKVIELDPEFID